jgi:EpsI family protein
MVGVALASLAPLTAAMLDRPVTGLDGGLVAPAGAQGWTVDEHPLTDWTPEFVRPSASAARTYVKEGRRVGAAIVLYRAQNRAHQLITSTNQVVHSTNPRWRILATGRRPVDLGGNHVLADTLEFSDARGAIVAWHWYWIDGRVTASGILGKVYLMLAKLQCHADDGALVVLYARADAGADAALADFARSMGTAVDEALRGAAATP